ncbi:MAG TPA: Crp/Fnr family transcriptional regulator [Pyrinomonadaceae bacterium]|jgi:CRP-like cAMP-binding protein
MNSKNFPANPKGFAPASVTKFVAIKNQILAGLPREKYHQLFSHLRLVKLSENTVLCEPEDNFQHAYFINSGVVSLLSIIKDGDSIEVGSVGNEGMVGISIALREPKAPYRVVVEVPGEALAVSTDILRHEFDKEGELKDHLLRYTHAYSTYLSQLGVCNYFHTLDKRLCRLLLTTSDRAQTDSFHLTHEFLSQVLGTGRTAVTMAAIRLQRSGLIGYRRGRLSILNRAGIEAASCDCYQSTKEVFDRLRADNFEAKASHGARRP